MVVQIGVAAAAAVEVEVEEQKQEEEVVFLIEVLLASRGRAALKSQEEELEAVPY